MGTIRRHPRQLLGIRYANIGDEMKMTHPISPRVYKLLKNTDLDSLSDDDLILIGNPITIEELNREELRRLVLVQLARLSVKQEWNGLLG